MTAPMDIGLEQQDLSLRAGQEDTFELDPNLRKTLGRKLIIDGEEDDIVMSSEDEEVDGVDGGEAMSQSGDEKDMADLEAELDEMYESYQDRLRDRDAKARVRAARELKPDEWHGINSGIDSDEEEDTQKGGWESMQKAKLRDSDSDDSASESEEESKTTTKKRTRFEGETTSKQKRRRLSPNSSDFKTTSAAAKLWFSQDVFGNMKGLEQLSDSADVSESVDEDASPPDAVCDDEVRSFAMCLSQMANWFPPRILQATISNLLPKIKTTSLMYGMKNKWMNRRGFRKELRVRICWSKVAKDAHIHLAFGLTTPEAMTLAQQLVNREKTKTQLINEGFNRYSLNSKEGLPSWFLDDEAKYYKANIPVTKEAMAALRAKQRALDARPIKKVAEAKARKKLRAEQRLEKARKKAEGVNSTADMSEREKAQAIDKLIRKGLSKGSRKKDIKVVVAKGVHRGVQGRPKGVKGRYLMVDSRMRKEVTLASELKTRR
jgi:AdoMet-dependent rRNA methyltransferase SPB1